MKPTQEDELREQLAAIEHERWGNWQEWVHTLYEDNNDMFETYIERWKKQIATPYAELSDDEKAADMIQVDRYWPLISKYIEAEVLRVEEEALKRGFYAGQAMARVELDDCHANWKKWNTP